MSLFVWYCIMAFVSFTAGVLLMAVVTGTRMKKLEDECNALEVFIDTHMTTTAHRCKATFGEHWDLIRKLPHVEKFL